MGRREDTMDLFHKAMLVAFPRPGMKAALEFGKWRPQSFMTPCTCCFYARHRPALGCTFVALRAGFGLLIIIA